MELTITEEALGEILEFDNKTQKFIHSKLEYFAENYDLLVNTKNVEKLTNNDFGRYKINDSIRAIFITFNYNNDGSIVILSVKVRENVYSNQNMQIFKKRADKILQEINQKSHTKSKEKTKDNGLEG